MAAFAARLHRPETSQAMHAVACAAVGRAGARTFGNQLAVFAREVEINDRLALGNRAGALSCGSMAGAAQFRHARGGDHPVHFGVAA